MNQANQVNHNITNFDLKQESIWKSNKMVQDCIFNGFSEGKNYNPTKHCKWRNQIKNYGEI